MNYGWIRLGEAPSGVARAGISLPIPVFASPLLNQSHPAPSHGNCTGPRPQRGQILSVPAATVLCCPSPPFGVSPCSPGLLLQRVRAPGRCCLIQSTFPTESILQVSDAAPWSSKRPCFGKKKKKNPRKAAQNHCSTPISLGGIPGIPFLQDEKPRDRQVLRTRKAEGNSFICFLFHGVLSLQSGDFFGETSLLSVLGWAALGCPSCHPSVSHFLSPVPLLPRFFFQLCSITQTQEFAAPAVPSSSPPAILLSSGKHKEIPASSPSPQRFQ